MSSFLNAVIIIFISRIFSEFLCSGQAEHNSAINRSGQTAQRIQVTLNMRSRDKDENGYSSGYKIFENVNILTAYRKNVQHSQFEVNCLRI